MQIVLVQTPADARLIKTPDGVATGTAGGKGIGRGLHRLPQSRQAEIWFLLPATSLPYPLLSKQWIGDLRLDRRGARCLHRGENDDPDL